MATLRRIVRVSGFRLRPLTDQTGRDFPVTLEHPGGDDPVAAIATSVEHLRRLGVAR